MVRVKLRRDRVLAGNDPNTWRTVYTCRSSARDAYRRLGQRFFEEQIAEDFIAVFGQLVLLCSAAVVFERQDHRVLRRNEGAIANRVDHVLSI